MSFKWIMFHVQYIQITKVVTFHVLPVNEYWPDVDAVPGIVISEVSSLSFLKYENIAILSSLNLHCRQYLSVDIKIAWHFFKGKREFTILSSRSSGVLQGPGLSQKTLDVQHYEILKQWGTLYAFYDSYRSN